MTVTDWESERKEVAEAVMRMEASPSEREFSVAERVKGAEVEPAGMVTVEGTARREGLLEERLTTRGVGSVPEMEMVPLLQVWP